MHPPTENQIALKGRIRQSIVSWPYMVAGEKWDLAGLCRATRELGCPAIELVGPDAWPTMQQAGLACALSVNGMPDPVYRTGLNNPRYQGEVIAKTRQRIAECAAAKVPAVITFTGFKWRDLDNPDGGEISLEEGAANTVNGLKALAG